MERDQSLNKIRLTIESASKNDDISKLELFQNEVIRPILKFQHDVILQVFEMFLIQKGEKFSWMNKGISKEKYEFLIDKKVFKDSGFVNTLIGMQMGLMTLAELQFFNEHIAECRRRIIRMSKDRIKSVFENQG